MRQKRVIDLLAKTVQRSVRDTNVSQYGVSGDKLEEMESAKGYAHDAKEWALKSEASAVRSEAAADRSVAAAETIGDNVNLTRQYRDEALEAKDEAIVAKDEAIAARDSIGDVLVDAEQFAVRAETAAVKAEASEAVVQASADAAAASARAAAASEIHADNFATHAGESASKAEDFANKSQEIYEAFAKGAVYRGGWNPKTGAYPPHFDVNSYWDVYLDEGETSLVWDNITWYAGDRLIYSVPNSKYYHINHVSGVASVNGQTGNVSITPANLGVYTKAESDTKFVKKAGDTMTGNLNFADGTGTNSTFPSHFYHNLYSGSVKEVYEHAYPYGETASYNSKFNWRVRSGTDYKAMIFDGTDLAIQGYKVYHENHKPTWDDIGGDNFWIHEASRSYIQPVKNIIIGNGVTLFKPYQTDHKKVSLGLENSQWKEVWSDQYRGGSVSVTGDVIGGSISSRGQYASSRLEGNKQILNVSVVSPASPDSGILYVGNPQTIGKAIFETKAGGVLEHYVYGKGNQPIYTGHNKPTTSDIGAVSKAGDTMTGALNIHAPSAGLTLKGTNNATYIHGFGSDGSLNWYMGKGSVNDDNIRLHSYKYKKAFEIQSGGLYALYDKIAYQFYHEGHKPTSEDVGTYTKQEIDDKITASGGGNVLSVNGQTGAVVLDAEDVGAQQKLTTPFSTRNYVCSNTKKEELLNSKGGPLSTSNASYYVRLVTLSTGTSTGRSYVVRVDSSGNITLDLIYSNGSGSNHPLLVVEGGKVYVKTSHSNDYTVTVFMQEASTGSPNAFFGDIQSFYSPENKPAAVDIGALPLGGGTLTGKLVTTMNNAAPIKLARGSQVGFEFGIAASTSKFLGVSVDGRLRFGDNLDHSGNATVYTSAQKPHPSEIGAMPVTGNDNFTWNGSNSKMPSHYFHNVYSSSDSTVYIHAYPTSTWDGNSRFNWRVKKGSSYKSLYYDGDVLRLDGSGGGTVYHTGNKPSPADVGGVVHQASQEGSPVTYTKICSLPASVGSNAGYASGVITGGTSFGNSHVPVMFFSVSTRGYSGGNANIYLYSTYPISSDIAILSCLNGSNVDFWLKRSSYSEEIKILRMSASGCTWASVNSTTTAPSNIKVTKTCNHFYSANHKPTASDIGAAKGGLMSPNVINFTTAETPNYVVLKSPDSWSAATMPALEISGRGLGGTGYTNGVKILLGNYYYNSGVYSPRACVWSATGSFTGTIYVVNIDGKRCFAIPGGYCCSVDLTLHNANAPHYGTSRDGWSVVTMTTAQVEALTKTAVPRGNVVVSDGGIFSQPVYIGTSGSTPDATTSSYKEGLTIVGGNQRMVIDTSNVTNGGGYIQMRHQADTYPSSYYTLKLNPLGGNIELGSGTVTAHGAIQTPQLKVSVSGGFNYKPEDHTTNTSWYYPMWHNGAEDMYTSKSKLQFRPSDGRFKAGTFEANDWFRSTGATGWYNETYGGGIRMSDTTWIRTYNDKKFFVEANAADSVLTNGYYKGQGINFTLGGQIRTWDGGSTRGKVLEAANPNGSYAWYIDKTQFSINKSTNIIGALTASGKIKTEGNEIHVRGGSPTIFMRDINNKTAFLHNNSNHFYVLRSAGNDGTTWDSGPNGRHPMTLNMDTGDATFSANVTAYSDRRLKTNIQNIENPLDKVSGINGVTYNWINDEAGVGEQVGVIAQDVEKVLPQVVSSQEDGTLTVAYGNMVGLLVEAIKELNAKVDSLQSQLNECLQKDR